MCILCFGSRWSRRIVAMLPWLVIPLFLLWALSQLLPPGFHFEITSSRLACVAVLLSSLAWYEIALPRLSAWRSRRRALLREKRRIEAQEVAKWRKEATRRCRNCGTPYKDQSPGGGRFMCTYCGHVSKRPVLDVPSAGTAQAVITASFPSAGTTGGLISGLRIISGENSKIWIGRGFPSSLGSARGWIGNKSWLTDGVGWGNSGLRFGSPLSGGSLYLGTLGTGLGGLGACVAGIWFGSDRCTTREPFSGIALVILKLFSVLLVCIGCLWRKLSRAGLPGVDGMNGGHRICQDRSEDTGPSLVTRGEKARRKAEEKRQARLEKEQLEAEERKQREEVARLVEERRRQRDEKLETEKESEIGTAVGQEREIKWEQETERRRQEKAREREKMQVQIKDREAEDTKRKKGKENEKRNDADKKDEMKLKLLKGGTFDNKVSEPGIKGAANLSLKGKHPGSAKVMAVPINKTSFWSRTLSTKSSDSGKSDRAVICGGSSPSVSNVGSGLGEKSANSSKSAWNRIPWTTVWGKARGKVPDDISKEMHKGVEIQNNEEASTSARGPLDETVVSPQKGSVSAQIQPIVPPLHTTESWNNLFSTSSGFPPTELPVDTWVCKGNPLESKGFHLSISLLSPSTQVLFGGSSSMGPLLPGSYTAQISEVDLMSSLTSCVSGSLNLIDFVSTDMPDPLSLLGPVSQALSPSPSSDVQNGISNTSSISVPSSMTPFGAVGDVSPKRISGPMNGGAEAVPSLLEPWNVPPLTVETTSPQGVWNPWGSPQVDLQNTSIWGNQLQPDVPQSFKSANYLHGAPPLLENLSTTSNFWPETHPLKSTLHSWEDSDVQFKIPSDFIDCITHSLMEDPVITADGHSYERHAIEAWLESHDTSPKTGETLPLPPGGNGTEVDKTLRPNHILRGQIIEYKEHLARWLGSQNVHNSGWTAGASDMYNSSWSSLKPQFRGFYPVPGVESVWSYNA